MEYRELELILVSGRDIWPGISTVQPRPEAYAKVWISTMPEVVHRSKVDREGGTNPTWNLTLTLTMQDSFVREQGLEVVVELYYERIDHRDLLVGEVEIPIPDLFDRGTKGSAAFDVVPTGTLTISYTFGEKGFKPPSFSSIPAIMEILPSANRFSPQDSQDKGSRDGDGGATEHVAGSLESWWQDLRAERKDWKDLRAERKDWKDLWKYLRAERKDWKAERKDHFGISSRNDPTSERTDHFGPSSWKDLTAEKKDHFETSSWKDPTAERKDHFGPSFWKDPTERKDHFGRSSWMDLIRRPERRNEADDHFGRSWMDLRPERRNEAATRFRFGTRDGWEIKEMIDEVKPDHYKRRLEDFILFWSIFPHDYEFTKDVLVLQWIATRLIELGEDEEMEEKCTEGCIDKLIDMNYIIPSGYDYVLDQTKYKIGDRMTTALQNQQPKDGNYCGSEQSHHDPTKVKLLSWTFRKIDSAKVEDLKQYSQLHTLVIHDCYEVDHLPSDIFSEMKNMKILNLSRTSVLELPSSFENLKELRFLDMSNTPLVWLPKSICSHTHLQTLKLDGCVQLKGLPEGTSKLINLRHLILDVVRQLESMPVGLGKLSNLRTLSAFLVGQGEGCSVAELRTINKLRGTFRLLNLENVKTKEEACLCEKVDLKKIELKWSDIEDDKTRAQEEILESLKPPVGIQELKILFYSGGMLPTWICDPSFKELVTIFFYKCKYCISLPSLGELPSLKHLSIIENNVVVEINSSFCRKKRNQYHAFPKLEKLTFESMSSLEKWTGLEKGDFPSLRHLIIEYCPKFVALPYLLRLDSLSHLEIRYCPKLSFSPRDRFPPSLQSLMIKESPRLKKWCCNRNCSKIARVPTVYFDHEKFTREM